MFVRAIGGASRGSGMKKASQPEGSGCSFPERERSGVTMLKSSIAADVNFEGKGFSTDED
jgi:hypothetical protein